MESPSLSTSGISSGHPRHNPKPDITRKEKQDSTPPPLEKRFYTRAFHKNRENRLETLKCIWQNLNVLYKVLL